MPDVNHRGETLSCPCGASCSAAEDRPLDPFLADLFRKAHADHTQQAEPADE